MNLIFALYIFMTVNSNTAVQVLMKMKGPHLLPCHCIQLDNLQMKT